MARYVCLSHKTPVTFRNKRSLYEHLVLDHRSCFSSVPDRLFGSLEKIDFSKFVCGKCGKKGFKGVLDIARHLSECQGVKIIYQRKIAKPVTYFDGLPPKTAMEAIKFRRTLKDIASSLNIPEEVADLAEDISEKYCNKLGVGRTVYIDAASLYIASLLKGHKVTQREIFLELGVTEASLRNNYKKIMKALDIESKM